MAVAAHLVGIFLAIVVVMLLLRAVHLREQRERDA